MAEAEIGRRRTFAAGAATLAAAIGLVVLVGWLSNQIVLTTLLPGLASMKANAALSLAVLGTVLAAVVIRPTLWRVGQVLAVVILALAVATIVEFVVGANLGIDEVLARDPASTLNPGRMSFATALALACAAGAIVTLDAPRLRPYVSHTLAVVSFTIAGIALIGYLYGVSELYSFGPFATVAPQAAIAIGLLSFGIILGQPESGAIGRAAGQTPGGQLIRRMVPVTAFLPIALGFVVLLGARQGLYSVDFSVALLVVMIVGLLWAVVLRTAVAIDAADAERHGATVEARRSAERHAFVTRTIADGILTIDESSRIEFANQSAERMFGYAPGELIGQPLTRLMPEAFRDRHRAALARYIGSGTRTIAWDGTELVGLAKDGREFAIEIAFAEDGAGAHRTFTGAIRDISARKQLEGQLLQAQRLESVGRLAGGIAHDFNNVLTAILGFASLALDEPADADPERENIRAIEGAAKRAAGLVSQLLAFSRQQVLRTQVLDVGEILNELGSMLRQIVGEDLTISIRIDDDVWPIEADRGQLEQVVVNLAVNARDAMPQGGRLMMEVVNIEIDAEYAMSHPEVIPGPHVLLAISDTGIGMDAETQSRIFEPFFTTKESGRGTGLGLATVYGIVKQSGGHIWVYSEPGMGTTFRLYFPRASRQADVPHEDRPRPGVPTGRETILVVEDERILRDLIEIILGRLGYRVLLAADGPSAIEVARAQPIDLLLTDVILPGQSGLSLAEAVRTETPALPILYMSGYTPAALEQHGPLAGGDDLIQKPFTRDALGQAVRRAIDQGRPE